LCCLYHIKNVKLKASVCLVLLFASTALSAQILIGPTAGAQVSWVGYDDKDYKDTVKVEPHVGYNVGFNLSFRVRKRFFLHTSFVYSTKGRTVKGKIDPQLKDKVRYSFLEVPIMYTYEIKTHVGTNKEFKWYFGAGPNISYWLGGKGTLDNTSISEAHALTRKYKVVFDKDPSQVTEGEMNAIDPNRIQLGLNLSAGFVFEPMGNQKIMLTLRYEMGSSWLGKNKGVFPDVPDYQQQLRSRNIGFRISVAYLIDLKNAERKKGKSTLKKKNR
jgi:hypothetical protein